MRADQLHRLPREVTRVDHQARVLVARQDRKRRVARAGAHLQDDVPARARVGHLGGGAGPRAFAQDGELLPQPLAVLEEVAGVVRVELVPPLVRVGGEAAGVEGGDGVRALKGELVGGVGGVERVGGGVDVVPGVESVGWGASVWGARRGVWGRERLGDFTRR